MRRTQCARFVLVALLNARIGPAAVAQAPLTPDSGKYLIQLQDMDYGSDAFVADASGGSESEIVTGKPGVKTRLHISVRARGGRLQQIDSLSEPGGRFRLLLQESNAKLEVGSEKQGLGITQVIPVPARPFPYCTAAPEQMREILAAYDFRRGGTQRFDVIYSNRLGANGLIQGTLALTPMGSKPMQIVGRSVAIARYHVEVPSPAGALDAELFTDSERRVLMFRIESQQLLVIRDGYQELSKPPPTGPTLSAATFPVKIERGLRTTMRDGTSLAADIYRPDAPGRFPVILQRTCNGRQGAPEASFYARRGYVFVTQDVRGKFGSEGDWRPWINEAHDGNDTIDWCAHQRWSNGSVGMIGASYQGFVQWAAASESNPHLKCLIPIAASADPFTGVPYAFGPLSLYDAVRWSRAVEGRRTQAADQALNVRAFDLLPVADLDKTLFGHRIDFFQEWLQHPDDDAYWQQADFNARLHALRQIPVLHVSGWFDRNALGTKRNYQAMDASGHKGQKLIYGPWGHAINMETRVGAVDFGPQSVRDLETLYLRWFDHWLKGIKNGVDKEPPVEVFVMGANVWRTFSAWPPREAKPIRWYLHSAGRANSDRSDGSLSPAAPDGPEPEDHYTYDPAHPFIPAAVTTGDVGELDSGPLLESSGNPDVLSYTSDAFDADTTIAGPLSLHLTANTSAKDTDWFAALEDVGPDGASFMLARGILQARFRKSFSTPSFLKPDEIIGYTIDLSSTAYVFARGHRIRLLVTSSCFPFYGRNLNTGDNNWTSTRIGIAHQAIFHSRAQSSYILLPTLPRLPASAPSSTEAVPGNKDSKGHLSYQGETNAQGLSRRSGRTGQYFMSSQLFRDER